MGTTNSSENNKDIDIEAIQRNEERREKFNEHSDSMNKFGNDIIKNGCTTGTVYNNSNISRYSTLFGIGVADMNRYYNSVNHSISSGISEKDAHDLAYEIHLKDGL